MSDNFWSGRMYCLITGASRGIGKEIAIQFSRLCTPGSVFLLLARNKQGLEATKSAMSAGVTVVCESYDLSSGDHDVLNDLIDRSISGKSLSDFHHAVIIHNAGTTGDVTKFVSQYTDMAYMQSYFNMNFFSMICLNSVFFGKFTDGSVPRRTAVCMSSDNAVQPFASMGIYCAGKAARDMIFKVFALENPSVNVLLYSPGPVDTDGLAGVAEGAADAEVRKSIQDVLSNKQALTVEQTVGKMVKVLEERRYKSGDWIDYYLYDNTEAPDCCKLENS